MSKKSKTTSKTASWADLSVKPKSKPERGKNRWDVDAGQTDHIYGMMTRWDRPISMWDRHEPDEASVARLKSAAVMVQTFVDALSGEQSNYRVGIHPKASTASTDLKNRVMHLPAKTILDPELSDQEAALLMVAFMGHEIGHVRFDNDLDQQMRHDMSISYSDRGLYNSLSTVLREARVEAGFSGIFPGYSNLFDPLLRWISRGTKDGTVPPQDALGFAVAATRYPFRFDWSAPEHQVERDWWVNWVKQYATVEDYPGHKAALDLAKQHIEATLADQPQDEQDDGDQGGSMTNGGQVDPSGMAGAGKPKPYTGKSVASDGGADYEAEAEKTRIDREANEKKNDLRQKRADGEIDTDEYWEQVEKLEKEAKKQKTAATRKGNEAIKVQASIPASIEQVEAERQAKEQSSSRRRSRKVSQEDQDASDAAEEANAQMGLNSSGDPLAPIMELAVENSTPVGDQIATDAEAVGIFRSAFIRMRGGNDGRIGGKRSGRLDDRRIFRLADRKDDRVFTRRGAAKTQPLRVYLMVDISGSMGGEREVQVREVAKALVEASMGADNLTLEVHGWDDKVTPSIWERGMDPDRLKFLRHSGLTHDAQALIWATDRMQHHLRVGEHGLIIMMSDGEGVGASILKHHVEEARTKGISVFGITMAEYLDQTDEYGKDGFVRWQGSVSKTAQPLAEIITRSWTTKDQHRG